MQREHGVSIVVGTVELGEDDKLYKSAFVVTPDGYQGRYRKCQPAPAERERVEPGSETPLFEIEGWKMAVAVCWDLYFPELAQLYAMKGADLYVLPSGDNAYPLRDEQHAREKSAFNLMGFRKVGPARACDNSMYVFIPVDANSAGGSVAFDPAGEQNRLWAVRRGADRGRACAATCWRRRGRVSCRTGGPTFLRSLPSGHLSR